MSDLTPDMRRALEAALRDALRNEQSKAERDALDGTYSGAAPDRDEIIMLAGVRYGTQRAAGKVLKAGEEHELEPFCERLAQMIEEDTHA